MMNGVPAPEASLRRASWTFDDALREVSACPACGGALAREGKGALACGDCRMRFPIRFGIPCMEIDKRTDALSREVEWYGEGREGVGTGEVRHGEGFHLAHQKARRAVGDALLALGASHDWTILSLATGNGVEIPLIEKVSVRIAGVDLSLVALQEFRTKFPYPVFQGNVRRLPFRDMAFDACVASGLLHHIVGYDDLTPYLSEFRRVLRIGGSLVAVEPNSLYPLQWVLGPVNRLVQRIRPGWRGLVPHERPVSPWFLTGRMRDAGFGNVRYVGATFLHNRMPLIVGKMVDAFENGARTRPFVRALAWWTLVTGRREGP